MSSSNLLPWRIQDYQRRCKLFVIILLMIFLLAMFSSFVLREIFNYKLRLSNQVNSELTNEQDNFAKKITILQQQKQAEQQWTNQFELIEQELLQQKILAETITLLPTLILPDIYLKGINMNSNEIVLIGAALSPVAITQFIQQIIQANIFKQIKLLHLKQDLLKVFDFSLQMI